MRLPSSFLSIRNNKDVQHVHQLAEKNSFDLKQFEKWYLEELRDSTTSTAEDNDKVFYRWLKPTREIRAKK
jgi:hypothetical protein